MWTPHDIIWSPPRSASVSSGLPMSPWHFCVPLLQRLETILFWMTPWLGLIKQHDTTVPRNNFAKFFLILHHNNLGNSLSSPRPLGQLQVWMKGRHCCASPSLSSSSTWAQCICNWEKNDPSHQTFKNIQGQGHMRALKMKVKILALFMQFVLSFSLPHVWWKGSFLFQKTRLRFIVAVIVQQQKARGKKSNFSSPYGNKNLLLWQHSIVLSQSALKKVNEEWLNKQNDWMDGASAYLYTGVTQIGCWKHVI